MVSPRRRGGEEEAKSVNWYPHGASTYRSSIIYTLFIIVYI
jgi:hypothetical protein